MTLRYNTTLRTAQAQAIVTEAGATPKLKLYTGTQPASVATAPSGTVLAGGSGEMVITFGTPAAGAVTFTVTSDTSADAGGTAGWFRIFKTDGTTGVVDGSVTAVAGGGDMTLSPSNVITAGGTIAISSASITTGNP